MFVPKRSGWGGSLAVVVTIATSGCYNALSSGVAEAPNGPSRAFASWSPGANDTCTQEAHDQYTAIGPDGKLYPTWHPPVDASGCTFGHEHGRDPRGSDLFSKLDGIPFGYANEIADLFAPHVGFKIEWENDIEMSVGGGVKSSIFSITCDFLVELHQGSAGAGSFIQPQHELSYHTKCNDGTELDLTVLSVIGNAGEFVSSCTNEAVEVAPGQPAGAPDGGGRRKIPDRACIEQHILVPDGNSSNFRSGLRESWQMSQSLRTQNGKRLASVGPYFNVFNPSRYHDPASPNLVGRPIDLCFEVTAAGERAQGGPCEGVVAGMSFDDPNSPFNGAQRDVDINSIHISNSDGPQVWYTDVYGKNASQEPFAGSIKQFISQINNEAVTPSGPGIGRRRDYGAAGVHAPN